MQFFSKVITLLALILISSNIGAQIYVDKDALGANDGSSWTDAYNDLTVAIYGSNEGDTLWIAEGVYLPGNGTQIRDTFFTLPHDLQLYGGFNGTESVLEERDPENNKVTLSADYLDNDIDDNFTTNKEDNALHVMFINENITSNTLIDGFTIAYGATEDSSSSGNRRRGGGILTYGTPRINNCIFKQNYGWFGGGLYPRGVTAESTSITNCFFEGNQAGFGAGIYIIQDNSSIDNCEFVENRTESHGAGIYNSSLTGFINNCRFLSNTAVDGRGAGVYHRSNSVTYDQCEFTGNNAALSTGGAVHIQSWPDEDISDPIFTGCTFTNCQANWGGAISVYNLTSNGRFENCTFENNNAFANGGAVHIGFSATSAFENSTFDNNTANRGGAFNSQNDTSSTFLVKCLLTNNRADFGGAFNMSSDDTTGTTLPLLSIDKSVIQGNFSETQGGAINIFNSDLILENSLLTENVNSSDTGFGGAISINAFEDRFITASIINSTFYSNIAISGMGGGISHFTDATGVSILELQNNIFSSSIGMNYTVEDGDPIVESLGGNLSDDDSMSGFLNFTNDTNQENPEFVSPGSLDFHLKNTSPCINTGIDDGASLFDIEDNPRQGIVDKGAFEFQGMVSIEEILGKNISFKVFPNPAVKWINLDLQNSWKGKVLMQITNSKGQVVYQRNYEKFGESLFKTIDLDGFDHGTYFLTLSSGKESLSRVFIK